MMQLPRDPATSRLIEHTVSPRIKNPEEQIKREEVSGLAASRKATLAIQLYMQRTPEDVEARVFVTVDGVVWITATNLQVPHRVAFEASDEGEAGLSEFGNLHTRILFEENSAAAKTKKYSSSLFDTLFQPSEDPDGGGYIKFKAQKRLLITTRRPDFWVSGKLGIGGDTQASEADYPAVLNSNLIGLYHGVEGRSQGNRFCPWKSISSTSLSSVGT